MNDLLRRRRAMMEKKSDVLNTSPRIAEYNKSLTRSNTGTTTDNGFCYTEYYDIDPISSTLVRMVGANIASGIVRTFQYIKLGGAMSWYYFPNHPDLDANASQVRFTLIMDQLASSYVYIRETGQILFAGKNTIYYGYTNIHDMPQG